jgi:hypothetical protein
MNGRLSFDTAEGLQDGELAALLDAFRPVPPCGRSRTAPTGIDAVLIAQPAPAAPDDVRVPLKDLVEMLLAGVAAARDNGQAQLFAGAAIAAACCSADADALPEALRNFAPLLGAARRTPNLRLRASGLADVLLDQVRTMRAVPSVRDVGRDTLRVLAADRSAVHRTANATGRLRDAFHIRAPGIPDVDQTEDPAGKETTP